MSSKIFIFEIMWHCGMYNLVDISHSTDMGNHCSNFTAAFVCRLLVYVYLQSCLCLCSFVHSFSSCCPQPDPPPVTQSPVETQNPSSPKPSTEASEPSEPRDESPPPPSDECDREKASEEDGDAKKNDKKNSYKMAFVKSS